MIFFAIRSTREFCFNHLHRLPPALSFVGPWKQVVVVETLRLEALFSVLLVLRGHFRLIFQVLQTIPLLCIARIPVCIPLLTQTKLNNWLGEKRKSSPHRHQHPPSHFATCLQLGHLWKFQKYRRLREPYRTRFLELIRKIHATCFMLTMRLDEPHKSLCTLLILLPGRLPHFGGVGFTRVVREA